MSRMQNQQEKLKRMTRYSGENSLFSSKLSHIMILIIFFFKGKTIFMHTDFKVPILLNLECLN